MELLDDMRKRGLAPDSYTYVGVIKGVQGPDRHALMRAVLENAKAELTVEELSAVYSAVVSGFAADGRCVSRLASVRAELFFFFFCVCPVVLSCETAHDDFDHFFLSAIVLSVFQSVVPIDLIVFLCFVQRGVGMPQILSIRRRCSLGWIAAAVRGRGVFARASPWRTDDQRSRPEFVACPCLVFSRILKCIARCSRFYITLYQPFQFPALLSDVAVLGLAVLFAARCFFVSLYLSACFADYDKMTRTMIRTMISALFRVLLTHVTSCCSLSCFLS